MTDSSEEKTQESGADAASDKTSSQQAVQDYIVLARKYRPSHFDELIGQDALVRTLKNAIETGRIAHAYMLTGVRGVGKTTTARIIAKALNYTGPDGDAGPTTGPTDDCDTCQAIANDRHPDVMEMDAASRTGVDDIREILDGVRYAPVSARYKVYIIDEVHMLSKQAFNALLKTLEEPPPHVIFIFATTEIRKVPVTVLSRCQRFDLKRVDVKTLQSYYKTICDKENVNVEDTALSLIAQAADGSVRDGLSLLDQAIAQSAGTIALDHVQDMLGLSDRGLMLTLFTDAITGKTAEALGTVDTLFQNGADPAMTLQDLIDLTHMLSRFHVTEGKDTSSGALTMGPDLTRKAEDLAQSLSMPTLGRAWDILIQGLKDLQLAPNPEKSVEMTVIRLAYAANLPDPAKLLKDLQDGGASHDNAPQSGGQGASAQSQSVSSSSSQAQHHPSSSVPQNGSSAQYSNGNGQSLARATEAQAETSTIPQMEINSLEDVVAVIEKIGQIRLATDIRQYVRLVSLKKSHLEFQPGEGAPKTLGNEIQTALKEATGQRWVASITSKPGDAPLIEKERAAHAAYLDEVRAHPLVKKVMEAFPGADIDTVYPMDEKSKF